MTKEETAKAFRDMRAALKVTRKNFCQAYNIPYRTVAHWEQGERGCPDYVHDLLRFAIANGYKRDPERDTETTPHYKTL